MLIIKLAGIYRLRGIGNEIECIIFLRCLNLLAGCTTQPNTSLYHQLGEQAGLEKLTDSFITQIGNDKQVFHYFEHSNISHFRQGFISHLCSLVEGPCEYKGDSMVAIHTGMNINRKRLQSRCRFINKCNERAKYPTYSAK